MVVVSPAQEAAKSLSERTFLSPMVNTGDAGGVGNDWIDRAQGCVDGEASGEEEAGDGEQEFGDGEQELGDGGGLHPALAR
jgi:hypothetical protein